MRKRPVRDFVQDRPVYVVQKGDSVLGAVRYMTEYRIGAVPIVDGKRLLVLFHKTILDFLALRRLKRWALLLASNHPEPFG